MFLVIVGAVLVYVARATRCQRRLDETCPAGLRCFLISCELAATLLPGSV